jgi:hypothetical protein
LVPVVAAQPGCGASTVALAVATACGRRARVVECVSASASGLTAASTAELGVDGCGWARGVRGDVVLERFADVVWAVGEVPLPSDTDTDVEVTVLDVAWDLGRVLTSTSWLADAVLSPRADRVVLVAVASVPGMRRLEQALALLAPLPMSPRLCVAVVGPAPAGALGRRLAASTGPLTRGLDRDGRCVRVGWDRRLAVTGLDGSPLPAALLTRARRLLALPTGDPAAGAVPDVAPHAPGPWPSRARARRAPSSILAEVV